MKLTGLCHNFINHHINHSISLESNTRILHLTAKTNNEMGFIYEFKAITHYKNM